MTQLLRWRRATADDAEAVARHVRDAFATYMRRLGRSFRPGLEERVAAAIADGLIEIGSDDRGIIASLWVSLRDDAIYVEEIAVRPDQQGRGFGVELLARAEAMARGSERPYVRLHTAEVMTELLAFYARRGFREVRRAPPDDGRDAIMRVYFEKAVGAGSRLSNS